jgi:FMN phosphatase YigB (HAD superfamily)
MFDYAFVDFDKTIFDCARFETDIKAVFANYGVTPEDYCSTYLRSLCTVHPQEYDYSFEEQIKFLCELGYDLKNNILEELNVLLQTNQYLFADTVSFLNWLKSVAQKMVLLTAGDRDFQLKKIDASGIGDYFYDTVVLNGFKEQYLKNIIKAGDQVLFVNDSLRENLAVKSSLPDILIAGKLPPGRYDSDDIQASGVLYFDTLTEIKDYVTKLK